MLVRQKQLALAVGAFAENSRGPRLFRIVATVPPGKTTDEVEAGIYAEIERLKAGPIADWEIEKSRNGTRRQFVGIAQQLAVARVDARRSRRGSTAIPAELNTVVRQGGQVECEATFMRVAKQYLTAGESRRRHHDAEGRRRPKEGQR